MALDESFGVERVLSRAGCPIHYWLAGPQTGPLVVLTHGAFIDHRTWAPQVPVLARDYRVLTWDVRGHGRSRPIGRDFSIATVVDDLIAILDAEGEQQAVLIGQSMGGNVAQEVVFAYPDRVTALVLLGCACNTCPLSLIDQLILRLSPFLLGLYPQGTLRRQVARQSSIRPEVQAYLLEACRELTRDEMLMVWRALIQCIHPEPGYRVTLPELLLRGEFDHLGRFKDQMPRWAQRDPRARYVVLPRAGHVANQDNPDAFNRVVGEFLRSCISIQ